MTKTLALQEVKNVIISDFKKSSGLGKDSCNRIIKVINGYGKREGFFNKISGVFYRIWNAVKAIFGQSDWQLASKVLGKGGSNEENLLKEYNDLSENLREKGLKINRDMTLKFADSVLNAFVESTYIKGPSSKKVSKGIKKIVSRIFGKVLPLFQQKLDDFEKEAQRFRDAQEAQ